MKTNPIIQNIVNEKLALLNNGKVLNIPKIGDIVELHYLHSKKTSGKNKKIIFALRIFVGLCISLKKSGLMTQLVLRNVLKRKAVELTFFVFSPLLVEMKIFKNNAQDNFRRNKLYYLRSKSRQQNKFRSVI